MRARTNVTIIALFLLFTDAVVAQVAPAASTDKFKFSLRLAQSSDNDFTKGESAEVIATFPDSTGAKDSWMTNAYLELGFVKNSKGLSFGATGEIHKNTLIAKKQDVVQYGVSIGKNFIKRAASGAAETEIPLTLAVKNSRDDVENTETMQWIVGVAYHKFVGKQITRSQAAFPSEGSAVGKVVRFSHDHNIGFAYLGADEDVMLGQAYLELNAFLFSSLSNKWMDKLDLFKLQVTYKGRTELLGETKLDLNSLIDMQAGINISFGDDDVNSIGLAYDWIQGADPLKGLRDQKYQTLTIKAKLVIE